jgi:hypothetical protein
MAFNATQEEGMANFGGAGYGGYGFGGGGIAMILLVVIVLWVLFRDGHGKDGHDGFGFGGNFGGCGPCVRPSFLDESNCEEEKHITKDLWKVDGDVKDQGCKDREATHYEGETTRALIQSNYIQDLRDKLAEKNSEVLTLKSEAFTRSEIAGVMGAIGKVNHDLERLDCQMLKRPPEWGHAVTPCAGSIVSGCGPRRGRCDFDDFDGGIVA